MTSICSLFQLGPELSIKNAVRVVYKFVCEVGIVPAKDLDDLFAEHINFDHLVRRVHDRTVIGEYLDMILARRPIDSYFSMLPADILQTVSRSS